MTLITGQFLDSGSAPIASGILRVQLNAPLINESPVPDAYLLPIPRDFQITNGALATCDLTESATYGVSYTFTVFQRLEDFDFYLAGTGEFYGRNSDRPTHLHIDGKYYSGVSHTPEAIALERVVRERLETVGGSFQAIVPNQPSIDFAQIARTGFSTDRIPQSARQVADSLLRDSVFLQTLINLLVVQPYSPTQPYKRGNIVESGGSSFQCLIDNTIGIAPNSGLPRWRLLVAKGDAGGTGGQNTVYNPGTWDNAMWAPTANVIRDHLVTLAPLASPAFTGTPTAPTLPTGNLTNGLATAAFVANEITVRMNNALLPGAPTAPTPPLTENSSVLANTAFVKGVFHRYSRIIDNRAPGANGGSSIAGVQTRSLNTIEVNSGDVVTLALNTFTLRPGTYRIAAIAIAYAVGVHRIFLWNNTSGFRVLTGMPIFASTTDLVANPATLSGTFAIVSNTDFQLRHFTASAQANTGLGSAAAELGVNEVYAIVELWRLD